MSYYRSLTVNTGPAAPAVAIADVKTHLRILHTDDDTYLTMLEAAATAHTSNYINRALIDTTYELRLDAWPQRFLTPYSPLQSVTSIQYLDTAGTLQTLATTEYTVDTQSQPGIVYEAYNKTWPSLQDEPNAVRMIYVAGYGSANTDVPEKIRFAIMLLIGHMYENREATSPTAVHDVPMGYHELLTDYRLYIR